MEDGYHGHEAIETLATLRKGAALDDLAAAVREVVEAVKATHKAGKVVLTIELKPAGGNDDALLLVTDIVRAHPPRPAKPSTLLFAGDDNRLSRRDPRQPELFDGIREMKVEELGAAEASVVGEEETGEAHG